jgi:hypothetical protein
VVFVASYLALCREDALQREHLLRAGVFEIMIEDLRSLLREFARRKAKPNAIILDSRTIQSTPESGARAGYDGPNVAKAPRCVPPWIRWVICWRCM